MSVYLKRQEERLQQFRIRLLEISLFLITMLVVSMALFIYICEPYKNADTTSVPDFSLSKSEVLDTLSKEPVAVLAHKSDDVYITLSKKKTSREEFELTVEEIQEELNKLKPLNISNPFENVTYQNIPYTNAEYTGDLTISNEEYEILLRITEAEAGGEDELGRIMVVHTILNRVASKKFPNTVKDVVFQTNSSGTYQYTPITNGRYFKITPSESTKTAVNKAIELYTSGTDESFGAEFFMSPTAIPHDSAASESGANWQRDNLVLTVTHGTHEFRKYPN